MNPGVALLFLIFATMGFVVVIGTVLIIREAQQDRESKRLDNDHKELRNERLRRKLDEEDDPPKRRKKPEPEPEVLVARPAPKPEPAPKVVLALPAPPPPRPVGILVRRVLTPFGILTQVIQIFRR